MTELTYLQADKHGLLQGVTELFPISSLVHSVLAPGARADHGNHGRAGVRRPRGAHGHPAGGGAAHLFFADPAIGHAYLIYRSYDGHFALVTGDPDSADTAHASAWR